MANSKEEKDEQKEEQREERQREWDDKTKEEMRKRQEKWDKKLKQPFAPMMIRRLFLLEAIFVVAFGAMDVYNLITGKAAFSAASMFGTLLLGAAVIGLPLLALCAYHLRQHKLGRTEDVVVPTRRYARITLVALGVLLLGWLLSLLLG